MAEIPTCLGLIVRPVDVPMRRPLQTSGRAVSSAPLVLVDLLTDAGVTGRAYAFVYQALALKPVVALLEGLGERLKGKPLDPEAIWLGHQAAFRLIGAQGLATMALATIDMAAWDALAKFKGLPLARLLGAAPKPIQAYNSNGLGIIGPERAAAEAVELLAPGFKGVKARLGYPDAATDLAVVRAVRAAIGPDVPLMSDYNQFLSVQDARTRVAMLDGEGLYWIEEPVRADDYDGHAEIQRMARTPIQMGESCWGPNDVAKALMAGASDYLMPDAMKVGGVTGWLRAAKLAEAANVPVSSHLFPEISVHLLAATPTAHWLEYVDWAEPILRQPVRIENGRGVAADAPGVGIEWDEQAVARYGFGTR